MISILFIRIKPTTLAASPEKEFKREITTGISPPPMGSTNKVRMQCGGKHHTNQFRLTTVHSGASENSVA